MGKIKHIVFDIGNVLVLWDPRNLYERLIPDAQQREWFLATVCTVDWNLEQDRGRSWEEGEALLVDKFPEHADLIRAFRKYWIEMIPGCNDGTVAAMERLIAMGHDVTLLTNFNKDTYKECTAKYPFLDTARGVTVSGLVGVVKPDPEIYRLHAESFGLDNEAILFFDDRPANVQGAKAVGWNAEVYVDTPIFEEALRTYGIE